MSKRTYDIVLWENSYKNSVSIRYTDLVGQRQIVREDKVARYEYDGDEQTTKHTALFDDILTQWSLERIDEHTEKVEADRQRAEEERERRQKEAEEYARIKKVFDTKIEIFNIPEISESSNREMKAKIRRSKTSTEAIINSVMLLMEERDNADKEDSDKE